LVVWKQFFLLNVIICRKTYRVIIVICEFSKSNNTQMNVAL
jgi:hypothetical protein